MSNNAAERALRGVAVGLGATGPSPARTVVANEAAAIYTLIETAKLNGIDPQAWLADVLARIADHPPSGSRTCCHGTGGPSGSRLPSSPERRAGPTMLAKPLQVRTSCPPTIIPCSASGGSSRWSWDSDFLDLVEPAYITFDQQGRGEFVFGAVQAVSTAATARTASASPGKAPTRWIPPAAPVMPNSTRMGFSRARSASTTATTPPSRRADGDLFHGPPGPSSRPVPTRPAARRRPMRLGFLACCS